MKNQNFGVELIEDKDGKRTYILRALNGQPITILHSGEELAQFFNDFKFAVQDGK